MIKISKMFKKVNEYLPSVKLKKPNKQLINFKFKKKEKNEILKLLKRKDFDKNEILKMINEKIKKEKEIEYTEIVIDKNVDEYVEKEDCEYKYEEIEETSEFIFKNEDEEEYHA